jgi:hypothetical protein
LPELAVVALRVLAAVLLVAGAVGGAGAEILP